MGGAKKKIVMIVGILVLLGAGMGAGMMLKKSPAKAPAANGVGEEVVADATKGEGGEKAGEKKAEGKEAAKEPKKAEGEGEAKSEGEEGKDPKTTAPAEGEKLWIYTFDPDFTVNLLDPKGTWFAKIKIKVQANNEEGLKQIENNDAPLRDATIMLLSGKTPDEVRSAEGVERIKRELLARYTGILTPDTVKTIYITDRFVMKR